MSRTLIISCIFFAVVAAIIRVKPQKPCDGGGNNGPKENNTGLKRVGNDLRDPVVDGVLRFVTASCPTINCAIHQIFYEDSILQPAAEQKCQAEGATLSSFQNQMESLWATYTVNAHIYPVTGSIWVGYKRRDECLNAGWTPDCTSLTSFEWTDKSANGTDGILWACNQPDNARGATQNCAILNAVYTGSSLGMDDVACDFDFVKENLKEKEIKAYLCGKKANA